MRICVMLPLSLLLLATAACSEPTGGGRGRPSAPLPGVLAAVRCEADAAAALLRCTPIEEQTPGARSNLLVIGGQHHYVRLASSGTTYDGGTDVLSSTVTVQNLLLAAMGTADGTTPDTVGVRVFFASGPTNGVTVENATGTGTFTASAQPYFRYTLGQTGGILPPGWTSEPRVWRFAMNGASSFSFTVYVQAQLPAGAETTVHLRAVVGTSLSTCGLSDAGVAYCWGSDEAGEQGDGPTSPLRYLPDPVQMPPGVAFASLVAGLNYVCALATDGRVFCWGSGPGAPFVGQPGGDAHVPTELVLPDTLRFSTIAGGVSHACGVDLDGAAHCWGSDAFGALGNGIASGSHDTPWPVLMPSNSEFTGIAAGAGHTCGVSSGHRVYCWGDGSRGAVGDGAGLLTNQAPVLVPLPPGEQGFAKVFAGTFNSCAVALSGTAYCWGTDGTGEVGDGSAGTGTAYSPSAVAAPAGARFTSIAPGDGYACGVTEAGDAYCWGKDDAGRLGNGAVVSAAQPAPSLVIRPAGVAFTGIGVGTLHACAVTTGPTYCWGLNDFLQLGDGTMQVRHTPVVVGGTR